MRSFAILRHYEKRGLRGAELRAALSRHAELIRALDPDAAEALLDLRVRPERSWVGRRKGAGRPVGT